MKMLITEGQYKKITEGLFNFLNFDSVWDRIYPILQTDKTINNILDQWVGQINYYNDSNEVGYYGIDFRDPDHMDNIGFRILLSSIKSLLKKNDIVRNNSSERKLDKLSLKILIKYYESLI